MKSKYRAAGNDFGSALQINENFFVRKTSGSKLSLRLTGCVLLLVFGLSLLLPVQAQNGHTLYGDLKIDESKTDGLKPIAFDVILYTESGSMVGRERVSSNGRYRFMDVANGNYDLAVEVENKEVARQRVRLSFPYKTDFRQDIVLEWRADTKGVGATPGNGGVVEVYRRNAANEKYYKKAEEAFEKKNFTQAVTLLKQVVADDPKDYQAWSELGTALFLQQSPNDAEKAYQRAIEENPKFVLGLINLGRLRLAEKNYEGAVEVLTLAVNTQPQSATANYYLGEAYLQVKKGSKAVVYLNEALKIDPVGKADAHLRLATLYNAAGYKDRAANEYEQFLSKRPDYPEKKKLQQYITENKKH